MAAGSFGGRSLPAARVLKVARLAERLAAAEGAPIDVDGALVRMMFEFPPLVDEAELRVELQSLSQRAQGLRLKARSGCLVINGQALEDVVIWSETAPPLAVIALRPESRRKPLNLRVWNVWRDGAGTMQAWIGDAGLVVEEKDDSVLLRCSDGFDEACFDDLLATLTLVRRDER